jgi:hypothetical protein
MVKESVAFPVPVILVAPIITEKVPSCVGVPEINPVDEAIESPVGSPIAE